MKGPGTRYIVGRRSRALEESIALRADCYQPALHWRARKACAGMPTDWWYDASRGHRGRQICATCPVRVDCTVTAMIEERPLQFHYIVGHIGISAEMRQKHRLRVDEVAA